MEPLWTRAALQSLAKKIASEAGLDPALVCAVVEQESSWNPKATRYEPAFYTRYEIPLHLDTVDARRRATSWGLMQIMGQCAREEGFDGEFTELLQPEAGLTAGVKHLKRKLIAANFAVHKALLAWNGGANHSYPSEVMARIHKYQY